MKNQLRSSIKTAMSHKIIDEYIQKLKDKQDETKVPRSTTNNNKSS